MSRFMRPDPGGLLRSAPTTGWTAKAFLLAAGALVLVILLISACTGPDNLTPEQSLFNIQEKYTEAGKLVLAYLTLPDCEIVTWQMTATACSDEDVRSALVEADRELYLVLKAAEVGRGNPDTAETYRQLAATALRGLRTLLAQYALTR